ncbi:MAG: RDD family protein [Tepidisphaeraceae bacterium]
MKQFHVKGDPVTQANPTTLPYAGPSTGQTCPLCRQRPTWKKPLYGYPVCKKCYYKFANRRQLAYLIDAVLFAIVAFAIFLPFEGLIAAAAPTLVAYEILTSVVAVAVACVFIMKDGFGGQSPGKRLTGVLVLDEQSGQPISFGQSFKRNAILLIGQVPFVGHIAGLGVIVVLAIQLNKGYRAGDRFASTRVIWKKYARSLVFGGDGLLCEQCGYELTGNVSGVCPECGTAVSPRVRQLLVTQVAQSAPLTT